jgi:NtrC-family two-component system sensor histidine kinase KinB
LELFILFILNNIKTTLSGMFLAQFKQGKDKKMLGLRQKLALGFGGLLAIIAIIGVQSILNLTKLGESIDVILKENYRSVIACQQMKEALERIDSGLLFTLLGYTQNGETLILKNRINFEKALQIEVNNITVLGEGQKAAHLQELYGQYSAALQGVADQGKPAALRQETYFSVLFPLFNQIKDTADGILQMNQRNMSEANDRARRSAETARRQMYALVLAGVLVSMAFVFFTGRWILRPIQRLIHSTDEIRRGNLDLVVHSGSRDEIGSLSESFNSMAASLREFRRTDQARLIRIQQATQRAFDRLPDAIAVISPEGNVEVATASAKTVFGLKPNSSIENLPFGWMTDLYHKALHSGRPSQQKNNQPLIQHFVGGEERYFLPQAVPILDSEKQPTGVMLILQDVTQLRQQDEIKRGVISTVSHQLKTPLTSIRMAIHLLLDEKVGSLTEKQAELLVAARDDSDRLHDILNNLLDISRMEAGKARLEFRAVSPGSLVLEGLEPFWSAARDQGVALSVALPVGLPEVWADPNRMNHVIGNLLSNALQHSLPGGTVSISAAADEDWVEFSIADTGQGIPRQYLSRIFEQFFRVPGRGKETGAGLGLAIVKEIIEAHGGSVRADSREGKGSTFFFTLKRADRLPHKENHP